MPYAKTSLRAEQRTLREEMRGLGMSRRQVAGEFARRYRLRPRAAWRHAHGWSLTEAARQINLYAAHTGLDGVGATVAMTAAHLCEHENWPGERTAPAGRRPTPYFLSLLATVYGCPIQDLLDVADYRHMPPADRLIVDKTVPAGEQADDSTQADAHAELRARTARAGQPGLAMPQSRAAAWTAAERQAPPAAASRDSSAEDDEAESAAAALAGLGAWLSRPLQLQSAGGDLSAPDSLSRLSERALVIAAAHESSEHAGWAEASNVGEATLEQFDADVRRLARDYVHVPPVPMFGEMLRVRNRVYRLLAGRQKPAATAHLHLLAGILCGLLANASTDLGYRPDAGHARRIEGGRSVHASRRRLPGIGSTRGRPA